MNSWADAILETFITSSLEASGLDIDIFSIIDPFTKYGSWATNPICFLKEYNSTFCIS